MEILRVLFSCTGVGILNRGIETFFREAFDGLKDLEGIATRLVKGAEDREKLYDDEDLEQIVWCLKRSGRIAPLIGKFTGRSAYAVEQWSSFPGVAREIRRFRPHVVYYSDSNLGFLLHRFRKQIGVPFRLLFSNGGPCHPPFHRHDFVQQVAPFYRDESLQAGESAQKHILVPYGIHVPEAPVVDVDVRSSYKKLLGLPADRPVVLSVGWISRQHKRMDYVIEEVARLPEPRPFLQMMGAMDEKSPEILELATQRLGSDGFAARSIRPEAVADYYKAADVFVLGSLAEGFGRVYLEALMHGLHTIGHRHPVMEYVFDNVGFLADLSQPGTLSNRIQEALTDGTTIDQNAAVARWESVRSRFSWDTLRPQYLEMFKAAALQPIPLS